MNILSFVLQIGSGTYTGSLPSLISVIYTHGKETYLKTSFETVNDRKPYQEKKNQNLLKETDSKSSFRIVFQWHIKISDQLIHKTQYPDMSMYGKQHGVLQGSIGVCVYFSWWLSTKVQWWAGPLQHRTENLRLRWHPLWTNGQPSSCHSDCSHVGFIPCDALAVVIRGRYQYIVLCAMCCLWIKPLNLSNDKHAEK